MTSAKCTALELEFTTNTERHHSSCVLKNNYGTIIKNKIKRFSIYSIYLHDNSTFAFNAEMAKTCYPDIQL